MKLYTKILNKFYFGDYESEEVHMIAIKINGDHEYMLLHHGDEEYIKTKFIEIAEKNPEFIQYNDLYLLKATDYGLEEINRCIKEVRYIGELIKIDNCVAQQIYEIQNQNN